MSAETQTGIVKTFMDLVSVDSATFHEEMIVKNVYDRLTDLNLQPETDKNGNILLIY
jgi:di/tripeptidase